MSVMPQLLWVIRDRSQAQGGQSVNMADHLRSLKLPQRELYHLVKSMYEAGWVRLNPWSVHETSDLSAVHGERFHMALLPQGLMYLERESESTG